MRRSDPPVDLSPRARVRLGEVFDRFETNRNSLSNVALLRRHSYGELEPLGLAAARIIRSEKGEVIDVEGRDMKELCLSAPVDRLLLLIMGAFVYLRGCESGGALQSGACDEYGRRVNEILLADNFPMLFDANMVGFRRKASSDAEILRRALLANPADVASCTQGDPQVEMVVSTVQGILARPNPTVVDYGAGLGRVLVGFATADRFRSAVYVAVDEPVSPEVKALAKSVGSKFVAQSREVFIEQPTPADVIIVMNTLHHIPFGEVPRQLSALLRAVKSDGILLVQEMGELREPEQHNVPWRIEDIIDLFDLPGCKANPRSMVTRSKKVPLTHLLVHVTEPPSREALQDALNAKCRSIWERMKKRTLEEIVDLYAAGNAEDEAALQHALITNANLDLNKPQ